MKQHQNISLSSRLSTINNLTEIKATAVVNSSIAGFLLFIQDVKNTPNWLTNAKHSEIIKNISPTEHIFTISFSAFWPLAARRLQLHSRHWQNIDLSVEIQLTDDTSVVQKPLTKKRAAENRSTIRILLHQGHWLLTPIKSKENKKKLLIEYSFIADSGGDVPQWLADQLALKSIWKTMKKIQLQLPKSRWQHQSIEGIEELQTP